MRLTRPRAGLRTRVSLGYALAAALALLATGVVVHGALKAQLTDSLDESLEIRATAVARLLVERGGADPGLTDGLDDPGETFTQVVGPGERLESSTPGLPMRPLLGPAARRDAAEGASIRLPGVDVDAADDDGEEIDLEALEETGTEPFETAEARVVARRVTVGGHAYAVISGATFEERDETLGEFRDALLVGAPLALALVVLAGAGAIGAALRPIERMRRRAAEIDAPATAPQLPVPAGDDELARLARTLNAMLARVRRSVEHEQALVADVSHELRTPLAIISGELELATAPGAAPEEVATSVRAAAQEARRLSRIAQDILLLARADQDRLVLRREALDARALLEDTKRRFATRADALSVEAPDGLALVGDRVRLEQALGNLVDNALSHGRAPVRLRAEPVPGGGVLLAVRDHGGGFPEAFRGRAFERFSRAPEARSGPGSGLGLAIVDVVARAHGGSAEAVNAPGGGAEVRLRLPG